MFEESEWLRNSSHYGNGTWSLSFVDLQDPLGPGRTRREFHHAFLASLALVLSSPHFISWFIPLSFLLLSTSDRSGKNTADLENQAVHFPPRCCCRRWLPSCCLLDLGRVSASVFVSTVVVSVLWAGCPAGPGGQPQAHPPGTQWSAQGD